MLAPRPAGAFVNENEVGAPTQGAKKGLQAKRGLNGRALGNVTNGAKPPQQQQVRPRAILGDISNRAAAPALSAGAKKEELPPVECLHVSDPAPPASFDLTSCARPEAVARAVAEHRAPIFGATARDAGVLEQASQSPKMELDTSFAMLAPELSRLQVTTVNDSDEDMELED